MSLTAVVHGFSFEFDSFEDYEAWYAETSHKLPEEPQIYYEDSDGNEMLRMFQDGEWSDYHVIDGTPVSEEDWEEYIHGMPLSDEMWEAYINGDVCDDELIDDVFDDF